MAVIQALCTRCITLDRGRVAIDASPAKAIAFYSCDNTSPSFEGPAEAGLAPRIFAGRIAPYQEDSGRPGMKFNLSISSPHAQRVALDVRLTDRLAAPVGYGSLGSLDSGQMVQLKRGENKVAFILPVDQLANGSYSVSLDLTIPFVEYIHRLEQCLHFDVEAPPAPGAIS